MHPARTSLAPAEFPMAAANPLMLDRLLQPRLMLFWGAHTPTRTLLTALTALAAKNHPLRVFDGGNRFDGYFVARLARRFSHRSNGNGNSANHCGATTVNPSVGGAIDPHAVLSRIRLSRAFTCFQLAELIENTPSGADPL